MSDSQLLHRRDKRAAAAFLKAECHRGGGIAGDDENDSTATSPTTTSSSISSSSGGGGVGISGVGRRRLGELLDAVLPPSGDISDRESVEWLRALLAGGEAFEEFGRTVRGYDDAALCGLVWTANFVAFRCRTCGISPCMSLCAECFNAGEHTGHDFNMFRSQAGGACDCGDSSVMRESGFCQRHGRASLRSVPRAPLDLLTLPELVLPRVVLRLVQHLREKFAPPPPGEVPAGDHDPQRAVQQAEQLIGLLEELTKMGGAMRAVLTRVLTSTQSYRELTACPEASGESEPSVAELGYRKYQEALASTTPIVDDLFRSELGPPYAMLGDRISTIADEGSEVDSEKYDQEEEPHSLGRRKRFKIAILGGSSGTLTHKCFLEELLFWTVKYEFPQKMVTLLLNMLPDQEYKVAFTKTFVQHYAFIMKMLMRSHESDTLSNRIVHISVQLFSSEELVRTVLHESHLLKVMVTVLLDMMMTCLVKSPLQDEDNFNLVVNCGEALLKNNTYWPLVSDFINILSHGSVARQFLHDHALLQMWMMFLSFFQGMNLNRRELNEHVEFESQTYYAAFAAELEACAQPMWGLLAHCKTPESAEYTRTVIRFCLEHLQDWFDAINFVDEPAPNQLTFHLPLHRYYAMFLSQAVRSQDMDLDSLLPDSELLMKMMVHPLQIQACLSEVHSNMWVRNGLQIKGQAMTYVQSHFCNSMIDPDIYLLQVCACKLDPDFFISSLFERFKVVDMLTIASKHQNMALEPEHERSMLEGALTFLVLLLGVRTHLGISNGMSDEEALRAEMVAQLCMSDKTHSNLLDLIPENPNPKSGLSLGSIYFESMLASVATFKAPVLEPGGTMQQGMYTPTPEVWDKEFDAVMVILRTVYRRDVQSAMDRYTAFLKQTGRFEGSPWPPYRERPPLHPQYRGLMRLLHCKTMHIVIFTLLYKVVMDHQNMSEHVLCMVLYLIELGLDQAPAEEPDPPDDGSDERSFDSWFPSSNLVSNMRHVISYVRVKVPETAPEVAKEVPAGPSGVANAEQTQRRTLQRENSRTPQVFSLVAERRRKFQEIINHNAAAAAAASPPGGARPKTTHGRWAPQQQAQLITAILEIRESMLSLLVKLHHKLSGRQNSFAPAWCRPLQPDGEVGDSVNEDPATTAAATAATSAVGGGVSGEDDEERVRRRHQPQPPPPGPVHGDGLAALERILAKAAKMSASNRRCVEEICRRVTPPVPPKKSGHSEKTTLDKEERRRRARERQQKLLAEFASRQKSFMETAMDIDASAGEEEAATADAGTGDDGCPSSSSHEAAWERPCEEVVLDCVTCGQRGASTAQRPLGLIVLLQATSVLGHRRRSDERKRLPTREGECLYQDDTCGSSHDVRLSVLQRHYLESSCLQSVSVGWEGGVYVQTCGHTVHLDCHKSYIESLRSDHVLQSFSLDKGEFACPLCRQLANSVLPCCGTRPRGGASRPGPARPLHVLVREVREQQESLRAALTTSNLTKEMETILKGIKIATPKKFTEFSKIPSSPDNDFLFLHSIARVNLELELVQRGGNLLSTGATGSPRRSCFSQLFNVLALGIHCYRIDAAFNPWSRLTHVVGPDHRAESEREDQSAVPVLYCDVSSLLLFLLLTMPQPLHKEHVTCVVRVLYTLAYVQTLAALSLRLGADERAAWMQGESRPQVLQVSQGTDGEDGECSWREILAIVTAGLTQLYEKEQPGADTTALSGCVWSPHSVEFSVQQGVLPFLRVAALLQHHLYRDELPTCQNPEEEFSALAEFLSLLEAPASAIGVPPSSAGAAANPGADVAAPASARCLRWSTSPRLLVRRWCSELSGITCRSPADGLALLRRVDAWAQPRLLQLPRGYSCLFQHYHGRACTTCGKPPKDPALCLVCGAFLCLKGICCKQQNCYECVQHSQVCGAGTAVFLLVHASVVIVVRGPQFCLWGSVYLDAHGEEDRDLRRGKPLFLCDERYRVLEHQWVSHAFDHMNKRWGPHYNGL
ncbi:E3 ubiquitin-protein ligase UBR3 isoform X3 [Petromyzon marinus]|uniref:E3 ubiquitin-protein ligase UBR3 isoform X3 n=1 Tax=Petromyzon marinus TaxID=7757 RepID=UPI003F6F8B27